jgi:ABC-type nitrate/sulfonate/bicarbonate transport system ATPase subunit
MFEVKNICKEMYSELGIKNYVLKNISFTIESEKITSIIGSSGSGKSTLLKIISSLELPTSGEVVNGLQGKIIFLPSNPSTFPWLSVSENISFGNQGISDSEKKRLVNLVGLDGYEKFYPNNKSVGFRFRVALARSLAHNPVLVLLDDVFKTMDNTTKEELYALIHEINMKEKVTFLIATSNLLEALLLSDKVYLLKQEKIELVLNSELGIIGNKENESNKDAILKKHIDEVLHKMNTDEISKISW